MAFSSPRSTSVREKGGLPSKVYRVLQQAYEALEQRRASAAVLSSPSFTSKSDAAYDASDDTIRLPLELRKSDIKKYAGSFSYSRPELHDSVLRNPRTNSSSTEDSTIAIWELSKKDEWTRFGVHKLFLASSGKPLTAITKAVLEELGLMSLLNHSQLRRFLRKLEKLYRKNEYHSSTHAADVVHAVYVIIKQGGLANKFKTWELLALVLPVAAAGHDVGHKGLSNKYLVDSKDSIVVQYGDISTNEQMHAHITTSLIKKFDVLPAHLTEHVCSVIKVIILDTDMRVHSKLVSDFDGFVKQYGADVACWPDGEARICCMGMLLHMADISNVAKPIIMAIPWAKGVSKEQQHERNMRLRIPGLEVAGPDAQEQVNMPASQLGFITGTFNIRAAFVSLDAVAPAFGHMALEHLDANVVFYSTLVKQGLTTL